MVQVFSYHQSKMIYQHNRVDHSVEIIGKKESKHLPDIIIKKQNMSLLTAAGMTEVIPSFHPSTDERY